MNRPPVALRGVLFVCLALIAASSVIAQDDAQSNLFARFHGGVRGAFPNVELPSNVPAPFGKLTLYADFGSKDAQGVPLYLINRTDKPVTFDSQDGDIYLKLERLLPDGRWERAQNHVSSWCGNSYGGVTLPPGWHFRLLGYLPTSGSPAKVRFSKYSDGQLSSNAGDGMVLAADIEAAQTDVLSRTAPSRIAELLDPKSRVPTAETLSPEECAAAMYLLRVYGANLYYKRSALKLAQGVKENAASTPQERQAAETIRTLSEPVWPSEECPMALLDRCIHALQKQDAPQIEYGMPEQQPALVWSTLADLAQGKVRRYQSYFPDTSVSLDPWRTVIRLVDAALSSHDQRIASSAATIVGIDSLSDELLPNSFFEKHLWDEESGVQMVCANTLSRRNDQQSLVSIAWKLPPKIQIAILKALAYPTDDLRYPNTIATGPRYDGDEKFWAYCLETMPVEAASALGAIHITDNNPFDRTVHDPLHNFFAKEAARSGESAADFEVMNHDYSLSFVVSFLDSWHLDEDTPVLQSLLNYKGYQLQTGALTDPTDPNAMKPFTLRIFSVRQAAKAALLKRGIPIPTDLVLEQDVTP